MKTSDFDYALPPELIAQVPPKERGTSRMMVLHRADGAIEHRRVGDIVDYLDPADLMVFNDTRVFAARAFGRWEDTPGRVEVLFVEPSGLRPGAWTALCRSSRPMKPGRARASARRPRAGRRPRSATGARTRSACASGRRGRRGRTRA